MPPGPNRWGLVSEVVPDDELVDHAKSLANDIASCDPRAVRNLKGLYDAGMDVGFTEGLKLEKEHNRAHMAEVAPKTSPLAAPTSRPEVVPRPESSVSWGGLQIPRFSLGPMAQAGIGGRRSLPPFSGRSIPPSSCCMSTATCSPDMSIWQSRWKWGSSRVQRASRRLLADPELPRREGNPFVDMTGGVMGRAPAAAHDCRHQLRIALDQVVARDADLPLIMRQIGLVETGRPDIEEALFLADGQVGLHGHTGVDAAFLHDLDNSGILIEQRHERDILVGLETMPHQDLAGDPVGAAADAEKAEPLSLQLVEDSGCRCGPRSTCGRAGGCRWPRS